MNDCKGCHDYGDGDIEEMCLVLAEHMLVLNDEEHDDYGDKEYIDTLEKCINECPCRICLVKAMCSDACDLFYEHHIPLLDEELQDTDKPPINLRGTDG